MPIGTTRLHRARRTDGSAVQKQFLGERRLARIRVTDDGEGAATADLVGERGGRKGHGFGAIVKVRGLGVLSPGSDAGDTAAAQNTDLE